MNTRTGFGYDVHPLVAGRDLVIGGVVIDHPVGLAGHSDADVLAHAVIDALLGAAGADDIGSHFPDTDERWRDADSLMLLKEAVQVVATLGFEPWNVDSTIVIEAPAISPHRESIRGNLSKALGLPVDRVNVKATRGEGLGFIGRAEGAAAMAVVTVVDRS